MDLSDAVRCTDCDSCDFPPEIQEVIAAVASEGREWKAQRRVVRNECRQRVSINAVGITPVVRPIEGFSYDASECGLGLIVGRALPIGIEIHVSLLSPRGHWLRLEGYIGRCREFMGWFDIGVCFYRSQALLSAAEYASFIP